MSSATIATTEGEVRVLDEDRNSRLRLEIRLNDSDSPRFCETDLPLPVVEYFVDRLGCHRLEGLLYRFDHQEVRKILKSQLFSYFLPGDFGGKRFLDFGCGHGSSTFELARLLPETEIVGIDIYEEGIEVAQKIAPLLGVSNVRFLLSPFNDRLPDGIGQFDYVMLCAVYEHLLPAERCTLMPLIWSAMRDGASMFVNETPYRYFPFEHHSAGLWFINYMPDKMAQFMTGRFGKQVSLVCDRSIQKSPLWEDHLRGGLRGATEWEIIRNLTRGSRCKARILQPRHECARDRADLWLQATGRDRFRGLKKALARTFRITDKIFGTVPTMNIDVVIRKEEQLTADV